MNGLSSLDKALLVIMALLGVRCLFRGFLREIFSFAGIIAAVILARMFHKTAGAIFGEGIQGDVLGYVVVFVAIIAGSSIVSWLVRRAVKDSSSISCLDRLGGFALGVFQGVALLGAILFAVQTAADAAGKSPFHDSLVAPHLINFIKLLSGIVSKIKC